MKRLLGRKIRHRRIRSRISGIEEKPRFSVFRSNKYNYAQLINDQTGKVLASVSDQKLKSTKKEKKTEKAYKVGELLAAEAKKKKIEKVVFDRGGYKYHGRVKAIAEGARKAGLKF